MDSPHYVTKYPKRKRVTKKNNGKLILFIFVFFLLIAIVIFLNSSISKISNIQIIGIDLLTEEEIYKKADINLDMYYFFADPDSIESNLKELDIIKEVEVTKKFPGILTILAVEQEFVAYFKKSEHEWVPVLENGSLYNKEYNEDFFDRPLITKWTDMDLISDLASELSEIKPSILEEISEITQNPQEDELNRLLVYTREGYRIHINIEDLSENLNLYPEIIEGICDKTDNKGDIFLLESFRFVEFNNQN